MWITIDPALATPLGRQIYQRIKHLILRGDLHAGQKLPSSRALSKELAVARNTVLEAYDQLLAEGWLEARHGSGTRVAQGIRVVPEPSPDGGKAVDALCHPSARAGHAILSFRSGIPDLEAFPVKEWARLYGRTCAALPASSLRYADPAGVGELREAIAAYLGRMRGIQVSPVRVMVTSGSTQALWLVSRLLRGRGGRVLVEDPAHRGLVEVVARAGYAITGIRADQAGMDTSRLELLGRAEREDVAFAYLTPSHQYPLGGVLPIQRRQALIAFARRFDCMIVEDDYDSEFRYAGPPLSSLFELDQDRVIYLGSFSKTLAPALRLGFAIIPAAMLDAWRPEKKYTDVHTDALSQHALAAFIRSGRLERHILTMRKRYRRKREHLIRELTRLFGDRFTIQGDATGLHVVAAFTGAVFDRQCLNRLRAARVEAVPVERYSLSRDGTHANALILGYSHLREEEITQGVEILKTVLDQD